MGGEKLILHPMHCPHGRITPAWAGKSRTESFGITSNEDHPRVGGEKGHAYKNRLSGGGSPPRGRGKD